MADQTVVHIGENSSEQVAYKLMETIASIEKKVLRIPKNLASGHVIADRDWILSTYKACITAVRGD